MSEGTQEFHWLTQAFVYGGITLSPAASQLLPLALINTVMWLLQPHPKRGVVWAIPRSLAATYGVSFDFLSYGYLDVSVPRVGFLFRMTLACRVSPFGHPRFIACLPAHRGFSQAPTSFIASYCQGIHLMPLVAFSIETILCARHSVALAKANARIDNTLPKIHM